MRIPFQVKLSTFRDNLAKFSGYIPAAALMTQKFEDGKKRSLLTLAYDGDITFAITNVYRVGFPIIRIKLFRLLLVLPSRMARRLESR